MPNRVPVKEGTFLESPEGGVLLANKCKSCGQVFFPKAVFCLTCLNEEMEEIQLSRKGKLFTYTIVRFPSMHFEPPYAIGYVTMPEGIRVFAPFIMSDDKPFKIGMDMELVIEKLWQENENEIIGYRFKPV